MSPEQVKEKIESLRWDNARIEQDSSLDELKKAAMVANNNSAIRALQCESLSHEK